MKFRSIFALCLVLALLLCACGKSEERPSGTVTPAQPQTEATTEPQPEAEAPAQEQTQPSKKAALGAVQGGSYENEYLGYGFPFGEGWVYKTAEELQDITAFAQEMMEGTALEEYANSATQIMDIQAENAQQLVNMNIIYTRLSTQEQLAIALMSEEMYIDSVLGMKDSMIEAYANSGMQVLSMDKVTVTFLGEERTAIRTEANVNGINCYMVQLYETQLGGSYLTVLTLGSFLEDNTQMLLDQFYPL